MQFKNILGKMAAFCHRRIMQIKKIFGIGMARFLTAG
jgi:hypothetical protein